MNKLNSLFWLEKNSYSEYELEGLKRELTLRTFDSKIGFGSGKTEYFFIETDDFLGIPKQYAKKYGSYKDLRLKNNLWENEHSWNKKFPLINKKERNQEKFVSELIDSLKKNGISALGKADPGFGKTVCGAYISHHFRKKTLVIADKGYLLRQWENAFKKFLGIDCGIVQQKKCKFEGKDVVLAMKDSLYSRDYGEEFYNYFSMIIVDECHHVPAKTWWMSCAKFNVEYILGFTATPHLENNYKQNMLYKTVGEIGAVGKLNGEKSTVFIVNWNKYLNPNKYKSWVEGHDYNLSTLLKVISEDRERNERIATDICNAALAGRKILVVAHRIEHLSDLLNITNEKLKGRKKCGWYTGSVPAPETKKGLRKLTEEEKDYNAENCDVLFGTWKMTEEGLNIEALDTLFMATPKKHVKQVVGRIERFFPGKKSPFVLDYNDALVEELENISSARKYFYIQNKFKIKELNPLPNEQH